MLYLAGRMVVGLTLLGAAAAKLIAPSQRESLAALGLEEPRARSVAWAVAIIVEASLGLTVLAGLGLSLAFSALVLWSFAALLTRAYRRGSAGKRCGCFGRWGRVSASALAREWLLGLLALGAYLDHRFGPLAASPVAIGFAALALCVCALAIAVLALAREVGMLRLELSGRGALEILEEGPEVGSVVDWAPKADIPQDGLILTVFVSEGCPVCHRVRPAIAHLAGDPKLRTTVYEEQLHPSVWEQARVPGSPYAIALDGRGTVLCKGTFNTLSQLESVLTTARSRHRGLHAVA